MRFIPLARIYSKNRLTTAAACMLLARSIDSHLSVAWNRSPGKFVEIELTSGKACRNPSHTWAPNRRRHVARRGKNALVYTTQSTIMVVESAACVWSGPGLVCLCACVLSTFFLLVCWLAHLEKLLQRSEDTQVNIQTIYGMLAFLRLPTLLWTTTRFPSLFVIISIFRRGNSFCAEFAAANFV